MSDKIYEYVRKSIRHRRRVLELTQEELADRVKVDSQYISRIERGKVRPSLKLLYALSVALECSIYDLLPQNDVNYKNSYFDKLTARTNKLDVEEKDTLIELLDVYLSKKDK